MVGTGWMARGASVSVLLSLVIGALVAVMVAVFTVSAMDAYRREREAFAILSSVRISSDIVTAREVIRRYGISGVTFYRWKKVYAGMEVADIKKLKAIQEENMRLKKLVADQALKIQLLEDVNSKKW